MSNFLSGYDSTFLLDLKTMGPGIYRKAAKTIPTTPRRPVPTCRAGAAPVSEESDELEVPEELSESESLPEDELPIPPDAVGVAPPIIMDWVPMAPPIIELIPDIALPVGMAGAPDIIMGPVLRELPYMEPDIIMDDSGRLEPAGEVATEGWSVTTAGMSVGWPVTTPRLSV